MSKKGAIPDAWDDEWVNAADKPATEPTPEATPRKLTKSQRRAQHQQLQKELWDTAENPNRSYFLEAQGVVPLKQEFKPAVKVLSRKPAPTIAKRDPTTGAPEDDEESEEEARKKREAEFEERQRKAKVERQEKQRKYAEARERIMGSSNPTTPHPTLRESSQGRDRRARQKGSGQNGSTFAITSQPTSAEQSPARQAGGARLFDPEDMSRRLPMREVTPRERREGEPIRQPRAPDGSGMGGFGFGARNDVAGS